MSPSRSNVNRRQSFRCRAPGQREAELVAGQSRTAVVLVDESATGFGVATDQPVGFQQGDVVQLRTEAGCFEVRVARILPIEASATDPSPESAGPPAFLLGLQRLRDLPHLSGERLCSTRWRDILFPPWISSGSAPLVVAVLVLIALVVGFVVLAGQFHWWGGEEARRQPPVAAPGDRAPAAPKAHALEPRPSASLLVPEPLHSTLELLLPNPVVTAADAIRELNLTAGQQRQLSRLLEQMAEALEKLDSQRDRLSAAEQTRIHQRLLDTARERVLDLLTDEQRETWQDSWSGDAGEEE